MDERTKFIVIGISDAPQPNFPPEVLDVIRNGHVFSGGRRHRDIVDHLLPADAEWIDITVPLDKVFDQYRSFIHSSEQDSPFVHSSKPIRSFVHSSEQDSPFVHSSPELVHSSIIIFASGDPLFFGFANTIRRKMPGADITVYPTFNSLQMLAHRLVMPYHDMRIVSLTGRPWPEFDRALIERTPKIGVLTDREHTPATIAQRLLDYGYSSYQMHVGEHLGNPTKEKVTTLTLEEAAVRLFDTPNCLILHSSLFTRHSPFGIPDSQFALLDGREKMITKMPIRLLALQALDLPRRHTLWDIGACTGSVSVEARLLFPHLHVVAFEIRPECEAIIRQNACYHGAPGIDLHIGDFLSVCCDSIAAPDAIFIGGHGGHLKTIMAKALQYLAPGGVIVMNSVKAPKVTTDSRQLWDDACCELGLQQEPPLHIQLNDHHPITILKCKR